MVSIVKLGMQSLWASLNHQDDPHMQVIAGTLITLLIGSQNYGQWIDIVSGK
jgi:hypothetical protein